MPDTLRKEIARHQIGGESQAGTVRRLASTNGLLFDRVEVLEAETRAADERVAVRLGEHRMARESAERALKVAEGQLATVRAELAKDLARVDELVPRLQAATAAKVDAITDATILRDTAKRERAAHAAELDAASSYARLTGGLVGVAVGVLVTLIVVAAL